MCFHMWKAQSAKPQSVWSMTDWPILVISSDPLGPRSPTVPLSPGEIRWDLWWSEPFWSPKLSKGRPFSFRVALLGGDLINIQPTCCCHHLWSIRLLRVAVFGERGIDGAHFILRISQLPSGLMTPGLPSGWSHRVKIPRQSWIISTNSYCCYEFLLSKPGIQ